MRVVYAYTMHVSFSREASIWLFFASDSMTFTELSSRCLAHMRQSAHAIKPSAIHEGSRATSIFDQASGIPGPPPNGMVW